jgi:hypothetical protein
MTEQHPKTALAGFLDRNRIRLVGTVAGGIALACVAQAISPSDSAFAGDANGAGNWQVSEKLNAVLESRTPEETLLASGSAVVAVGDLDEIREAISDKRARLENAAKELESLEDMIASAEGLEANERDDAIAAALLIYNESLAAAEFDLGVDVDSDRARDAWRSAKSSSDFLMALHPTN